MKLWRHICGNLKTLRQQILNLCSTIIVHVTLIVLFALVIVVLVIQIVLHIFVLARIVRILAIIQVTLCLRVVVVSTVLSTVVGAIMRTHLITTCRLEASCMSKLGATTLILPMLIIGGVCLVLILFEALQLFVNAVFLGADLVIIVILDSIRLVQLSLIPYSLIFNLCLVLLILSKLLL